MEALKKAKKREYLGHYTITVEMLKALSKPRQLLEHYRNY